MIAALIGLLLAAAEADLTAAQDAFAKADYAAAERLALAAAHPPQLGAALYLAGLSRFRSGKPAEALEAIEQAGRAGDRPAAALWSYNRGACLYELGRHAEAEAAFAEAAAEPGIAAAALVNAGFAALDGGSHDRARAFAARARAAAAGPAIELVANLEAQIAGAEGELATEQYRLGLAAYDTGRYAEARRHFLRASELDPADGRSLIMAGASALKLGERAEARADLRRSLNARLDSGDVRTAHAYLAALGRTGLEVAAYAGAGFDSNALQTSLLEPHEFPGTTAASSPSALASVSAALSYRALLGEATTGELAYSIDQLIYFAPAASDRSYQQHGLSAGVEHSFSGAARVGAAASAQAAFTGLGSFRGLQLAGVASTWGALDEGATATTRVDFEYARKAGLNEFDYLTGDRFDASATQEVRAAGFTFDAGYRFRAELIGSSTQVATPPQNPRVTVDPFGYVGHTFWVSARRRVGDRLVLDASAGIEWRGYVGDNLVLGAGGAVVDRRRREDTRSLAGAGAWLSLTDNLGLTLRYDALFSRSNASGPDGNRQGDNRSYDKHVVIAGTSFLW